MENLDKILVKHFAGQASQEEEVLINNWRTSNVKEYDTLKNAWLNPETGTNSKTFNTGKAWENVARQTVENGKIISIFRKPAIRYGIAASVALVLGLIVVLKMGSGSAPEITNVLAQVQAFENSGNSVKEVQLPDGSTVWLSQKSSLKYTLSDNQKRSISLNGKAFFDVKKDASHPFEIICHQGTVTVLGTSFNVDDSDSLNTISVATGTVKVALPNSFVILTPGLMVSASAAGLSPVKDADINYLAWKTGEFSFVNTPLSEIVKTLNTYYKNRFVLESKDDCRISAHFKNNSIEEIEQTIVLTCSKQFLHEGGKTIFR